MKYYKFLAVIVIPFLFISCNDSKLLKTPDKKEYIEYVSGLSDDSRKKQLVTDAEFLTSLLDSEVTNLRIYFSFSFGSGGSGFESAIDTAQCFTLPHPDTLQVEFSRLNEFTAIQHYAIPQSSFEIHPNQNFKNLNTSYFEYEMKQTFKGNKPVSLEELGLQKADSLLVTASYAFHTAFETVEIDRSTKDSLKYKDYVIDIEEMDDTSISIEVPFGLNVLGYQALSRDGVLMDTKGHSSYPLMGLNPLFEEQLREMANILTAASQLSDKDACIAELEKISIENFSCIQFIIDFREDYKKLKDSKFDDILNQIQKYKQKYADVFGPRLQSIEMNFPQPYSKILLYVSTETKSLSRDIVAVCEEEEDTVNYFVFTDMSSGKSGVMDKNSVIIIPANYTNLRHIGGAYFQEYIDDTDNTLSYYLNEEKKAFEKLPEHISFWSTLKDSYCVFEDKEGYRGVLLNNKKLIVPYLYDKISLRGNTLIARGSKRGRDFYEFYTLDGKKIDIPAVKSIKLEDDNLNVIVQSQKKMYGLIDAAGTLIIPMQYPRLKFLNENLLAFSMSTLNESQYTWQIIDTTGKEVSPYKFSYIYEFHEGYALVEDNDNYYLIDTNGKRYTPFPPNTYVRREWDEDENFYYETRAGQKYTFDGTPIKN